VRSTIEGVDETVHPDGRTNVVGLVRWVAAKRGDALRSMRDALTALRALERVAYGRRLDGARPRAEAPALPVLERD
jgi:hypothetical protein